MFRQPHMNGVVERWCPRRINTSIKKRKCYFRDPFERGVVQFFDDYIVFLQEHEFDTGEIKNVLVNFIQFKQSANRYKCIAGMNDVMKFMKDKTFEILSSCLKV